MDDFNKSTSRRREYRLNRRGSRNSQVYTGIIIVVIGMGILLRRIGLPLPSWLFGWEMLLIVIGIIMGIRSGFRDMSWLIPIVIGSVFIVDDLVPGWNFGRIGWPLGIIAIGLVVLTKGQRGNAMLQNRDTTDEPSESFQSGFKKLDEDGKEIPEQKSTIPEDGVNLTAVFGGVKRSVVSKNFLGGEITAVFGGVELDLTHADINGVVRIDATNILGGTKLFVPPTWDIQSEMVAVFGGVEDKRRIQPDMIDRNKRLIIMGTSFLGGLEIRSF